MDNKYQTIINQLYYCLEKIDLGEKLKRDVTQYIAILELQDEIISDEVKHNYCILAEALVSSVRDFPRLDNKSRK